MYYPSPNCVPIDILVHIRIHLSLMNLKKFILSASKHDNNHFAYFCEGTHSINLQLTSNYDLVGQYNKFEG